MEQRFFYDTAALNVCVVHSFLSELQAATHYANCDVISGQNKKFKLKYLMQQRLERKNRKELVLEF